MPVILDCPGCGARNRVPLERVRSKPKCGRCNLRLPVEACPLDVDSAAFETLVLRSAYPVLVAFWASWSKPSVRFTPAVEKLAQSQAGRLRVVRVNIDRNPELASRYDIESLPTVLVFIDGCEVTRKTGVIGPSDLELFVIHEAGLLAA